MKHMSAKAPAVAALFICMACNQTSSSAGSGTSNDVDPNNTVDSTSTTADSPPSDGDSPDTPSNPPGNDGSDASTSGESTDNKDGGDATGSFGADTTDGIGATDGIDGTDEGPIPAPARHVLLIIIDDFGIDSSAAYGDFDLDGTIDDGRTYAPMPTMHSICASGIRFFNAWAAPICSPTRGGILTGRYGFRYGIGGPVTKDNALSTEELTLPEILTAHAPNIAHANIGKWHLGTTSQYGGLNTPNEAGWNHYAGKPGGSLESYFDWKRTVNGVEAQVAAYATTQNVDDTIEWLAAQNPETPWLVWLAFNAPHIPFHLPPPELHSNPNLVDDSAEIESNPLPYYRAMLEALDTEVGRLRTWIENNGHGPVDIILVGDNGTFKNVIEPPFKAAHSKGTVYEGGVNVPLCISGPAVMDGGRDAYALVQTVDFFSTIGALFDIDIATATSGTTIDSVPFNHVLDNVSDESRTWMYAEVFEVPVPNSKNAVAVRNAQYKLIREAQNDGSITEEFFDLLMDPHEDKNLIFSMTETEQGAYAELASTLDTLNPGGP